MRLVTLFIAALALAGCDDKAGATDKSSAKTDPSNVPADNTKKNERDRSNETPTPGDQGSSEADRTITQKIRQAVVKSDTLSMTGKNVKIITIDNVVTLRGPVKSEQEKTDIAALAQGVEGVKRVENQLEIAAK